MDWYVWRIPTVLAVMAGSMLLLFSAAVVASHACRQGRRVSVVFVALGVLAILATVAIRSTAMLIARRLEIDETQIDPGPLGYLAPGMLAAFAYVVGRHTLRHAWTSRKAVAFYIWVVVFTLANIINRCTPGWCETIGFPFAWRSWSDAILEVDWAWMDVFRRASEIAAVAGNLVTFAVGAYVISSGLLDRQHRLDRRDSGGGAAPRRGPR
jgi:hypothetical protein